MSDQRAIVAVTRKLTPEVEAAIASRYDARFNRTDIALSAEQITQLMKQVDVMLCTVTDKILAEHVSNGSVRVKLLANFGVGVNHIERDAMRRAGISITNTPDVLTEDTADIALGLMLMSMRRMGEGERHVRMGAWSGWRPTHLLGRSVRGKLLGIVGYGRIGRAMARSAAAAFGMHVIWYAPRLPRIDDPASDGPPDATRVDSLQELLQRADVVSLHCPATPETRHLMNADTLAMMRPTSYLVNTARGDIVDEYALAAHLRERKIAGAGLDVYEFEPSVVAELRELENVVLLPHQGSGTIETRERMGMRALANIDAFVAGQAPPDLVTW